MPVTQSAKKALRVSLRKQTINVRVKSQMKSAIDAFKKTPSVATLSAAFSRIDRAAKQKLLHRNTAARRKAVLSRQLAK
jgi:small subunit ribosomal protein S20